MKWISAAFLLIAMIGCSGGGSTPGPATEANKPLQIAAPSPATEDGTLVGLIKNGEVVRVGAESDTAIKILRSGAQGGFTSEKLPDGFSSPYKSHIWQAGESGFGILTYKGRVVMAMLQDANSTQEHLTELRTAQQALVGDQNSPTVIEGQKLTYWFWHDTYSSDGKVSGQTMMLMAFQRASGKVYIASAMGDDSVLNALGISEAQAKKDQQDADQIIQKIEAEQSKKTNVPTP